jgi:hypothetical protein
LISTTIDETKDIPEVISETGKIGMPHKGMELQPLLFSFHLFTGFPAEIMQKIGQLFLLRTNINSVGSALDSPVRPSNYILITNHNDRLLFQEVFWVSG